MYKIIIVTLLLLSMNMQCAYAVEQTGTSITKSNHLFINGEIIAAEISKATGYAISPILGISVLGAYTYYTTQAEQRGKVPWHARPTFWGPLLAVLLGIILKDSSKIALPKIIIMPLDAIENLLEKNASAALGLLVILSSITGRGIDQLRLAGYTSDFSLINSAYAIENGNSAAAMASSVTFETALLSVLVTIVFGLVWVVSQSFNFLILLCPFSWLDLLLALFKNSIIGLLLGAYLINPFLGLFVSCLIILASAFMFARSYRFVIFGTLVSADIVFRMSREHQLESNRIRAFAASTLDNVPALSYGSLSRQGSNLLFQYRPWPFMPLKKITPPYNCEECEIGLGTLSPVIVCSGKKIDTTMVLFRLRPIYNTHESTVAELLSLKGVRDMTLGKTFRDGYQWLKEQTGLIGNSRQIET